MKVSIISIPEGKLEMSLYQNSLCDFFTLVSFRICIGLTFKLAQTLEKAVKSMISKIVESKTDE